MNSITKIAIFIICLMPLLAAHCDDGCFYSDSFNNIQIIILGEGSDCYYPIDSINIEADFVENYNNISQYLLENADSTFLHTCRWTNFYDNIIPKNGMNVIDENIDYEYENSIPLDASNDFSTFLFEKNGELIDSLKIIYERDEFYDRECGLMVSFENIKVENHSFVYVLESNDTNGKQLILFKN